MHKQLCLFTFVALSLLFGAFLLFNNTSLTHLVYGPPVKEKLSVEMLTWISDELLYDYIVVVDIDPAVFDFEPDAVDRQEESSADHVTIDFLSRILFPHENREIALSDIVGNELSNEKIRREMVHISAKTAIVSGTAEGSPGVPAATIIQDGIPKRSNFPTQNSRSPFETGKYSVTEKGFYLDRRAVTNREYREFIRATNRTVPRHWNNLNLQSNQKDEPVVNISYEDASAYAAWVGKRLPKISEYERAVQKNPSLRTNAPLNEWTATPAGQGQHYRYGGAPAADGLMDSYTGFRLALDDAS